MKKSLLFAVLFASLSGFSQTFDNIPTGTGYYMNKIIASPSGDDLTNEYIEIRGPENEIVPSTLYFITIEGDGNSSSRGKVSEAIQLGDGVRTFGSNGILAITCNYTDTDDQTVTPSPYISLISSDASVIEISLKGADVTSSSSSGVTSQTPDIGYDGNLIDATATYMLISSDSNPKSVRIDGTSDASDADGIINDTGAHTSWTLYDSVTWMDDDDVDDGENGEYGYGQIVYAQQNAINAAKNHITTSATIVDFNSTSDANYILRQGLKTGYSADDWIVAGNGSTDVPNWSFSSTETKVYPSSFAGWDKLKDYYGSINVSVEALTIENVFSKNFSIYPNPVKDVLNITSHKSIEKVVITDLSGRVVLYKTKLKAKTLDVSSLPKGVYVLTLDNGDAFGTTNFIKK